MSAKILRTEFKLTFAHIVHIEAETTEQAIELANSHPLLTPWRARKR
jgi:hypothetical protein